MTRTPDDHWQTGDPDLPQLAQDLAAAQVDAEVVLVQLHDRGADVDPDVENEALATAWKAGTAVTSPAVHGRRLSWRSFVLLTEGDPTAVCAAIGRATEELGEADATTHFRVTIHRRASSGAFYEDVQRLEAAANGSDRPD